MESEHTDDILAAATSLVKPLREMSVEIEENRRLPSSAVNLLSKAGMFRLLTPKTLGGLEVTPMVFSEALQTLSKGDASASWCAMIADTAALLGAYLEKPTADQIFKNPDVVLAGVFAPMGKAAETGDTYTVSGRWQWASGSTHADWLAGGALVTKNGKTENRMMIFPSADVELIDTWHVAGLKGTGSGDMAVKDATVPKGRSVSLLTDKPVIETPLYVFPVFGLLALGVASVALGNARAAIDAFIELAGYKPSPGSKRTIATRQTVQAETAKAEAALRSARAFLRESVEQNWQGATRDGRLNTDLRAALRLACTNATRVSADVCRAVFDLAGGSAVWSSNELQRRFRDASVMAQHIMVAPIMYEGTGRVLLGVETDTSMM